MTAPAVVARVKPADLPAELHSSAATRQVRVVGVYPHTLLIEFADGVAPTGESTFDGIRLLREEAPLQLGRCAFVPHPTHPMRRHDDPPPDPGHGRVLFLDGVYDFSALVRDGAVGDIDQKLQQLQLIWQRKEAIRPAFRDFTADALYDMQAYRLLLDEIDRDIAHEPIAVRARIRLTAVGAVYPEFARFFDAQLERLAAVVAEFSRQEHERHGFYFRKHVWDLILSSPFLARTNTKPRGYAGDSAMMNMVYEDAFRGPSLFSMCMHRHPIRTPAAQAVRQRRKLIAESLHTKVEQLPSNRRLRVMSVACGPAAELADVLRSPADADRFEFTLLDQDAEALAEATASAAHVAQRLQRDVRVRPIQESVRTMLRAGDLAHAWGRFDFVYTMGLFDYLQQPVARVVLAKLYELLEPGGEIIVGNFHVKNPTRTYMEYWMDWVLLYRTEEELLALAADLPDATSTISFEETHSQMFLHVRKAA